MSETNFRAPTEIVASISQNNSEVRNAAAALTERIRHFESYLSNLPGRVDAKALGPHPDAYPGSSLALCLRLSREGKDWAISWATFNLDIDDPDEEPREWRLLIDAPLKIKKSAVYIFSDLLLAIEKSQAVLVKELNEASANYDEFAKTLNQPSIISPLIAPNIAGETPQAQALKVQLAERRPKRGEAVEVNPKIGQATSNHVISSARIDTRRKNVANSTPEYQFVLDQLSGARTRSVRDQEVK